MDPTTRLLFQGSAGAAEKVYVEDVFSTWLYTGNGSTQTITNGIDLSGKGGLTWIKPRSTTGNHIFTDTSRGADFILFSNTTGQQVSAGALSSFNSTGFSLTSDSYVNASATSYASWTFRKQAKFFDVVTWTGNNIENRAVPHSLGSTPGCIIVKETSASGQNWHVWHRSLNPAWTGGTTAGVVTGGNATGAIYLNSTAAFNSSPGVFTYVNSTAFGVYYTNLELNSSGSTYVAYLFAHDAGGFGDSGNDSIIKCGSYTGNGSLTGPTIDLGWEPQWLLVKSSTLAQTWYLVDTMRGLTVGDDAILQPNLSDAEFPTSAFSPLATGFQPTANSNAVNANGQTYIYIAIRRGPMKTPTDATKVFTAVNATSNGTTTTWTTNFPVDLALFRLTAFTQSIGFFAHDRIRGEFPYDFGTASTAAETNTSTKLVNFDLQTTFTERYGNTSGRNLILEAFRRAPGFFDVVCLPNNTSGAQGHNLGVVPELVINKARGTTGSWRVACSAITGLLYLETTDAKNGTDPFQTLVPCTSTTVNVNGIANNTTNVTYLFASCPGVSKVGSYTGTGTTQQINCGFTAGARFVLIKRTDSTGDWYVWDTARGIISGDDPYLLLNSTAAEVTNTDYIDPLNAGFEISSTAPAAINANGGSYIYLAIA